MSFASSEASDDGVERDLADLDGVGHGAITPWSDVQSVGSMTVPKPRRRRRRRCWVERGDDAARAAAGDEAAWRPRPSGPSSRDANWPVGGVRLHLGEGHPAELALPRAVPQSSDGVVDVGGDDEHVGAEGAGEQGGGEVLVDDGLDAAQPAVGLAHDGDAAAAGRDDDVAGARAARAAGPASSTSSGSGEATTRRQPFSPRSSHVCAVVDQRLRLLAGEVAADRLGRVGEAGVVAVDERAGDERGDGAVDAARRRSAASRASRMVKPIVPCVWAPHQSSGTGRHDVRGELVLDQQVADLRAVAVGDDDLVAGGDEVGDAARIATPTASIWAAGVALPSGAVIALPPRASRTRTSATSSRAVRSGAGARSRP